jgi:DNA polymerase I
MIVTPENFSEVIGRLLIASVLATDTETTGTNSFKDAELFSIIISTPEENYYFNFIDYPGEDAPKLDKKTHIQRLCPIVGDESKTWYLQNAKFDLHMLAREGLFIKGKVYDLMFLDRIHFNQHLSYRLADISERWSEEKKLDTVSEYIKEHKLEDKLFCPKTGEETTQPRYDKVPFSLIAPYGCRDGLSTLTAGRKILQAIKDEDVKCPNFPAQMNVVETEARLVHTLFRMEHLGVKIDEHYCSEALNYYRSICESNCDTFKKLTGLELVKGTLTFEEVFKDEENLWQKTYKNNYCWDTDQLKRFKNPAAYIVIKYAEAKKQADYFSNFLFHCDKDSVIHPNYKQVGCVTSRLSCTEPNLQNLTNPDKYEGEADASKYPVRKAFIPREGFFFSSLDFSQIEYRVFLDAAKANGLIKEIIKGLDVHSATALLADISRKEAKTVNFLCLYGGGIALLAMKLFETKGTRSQISAIYKKKMGWRMSDDEAEAWKTVTSELIEHNEPLIMKAWAIQQSVFRAAPELKDTMKAVQKTAEVRGYIFNKYGRRYQFPDKKWCYKAPNHLIQGASAEVLKLAMNAVDEYLLDKKSKMILSIHDEIILQVAYGEEYVIEHCKAIMIASYQHKLLPLDVDTEYSYTNLADKKSWPPADLKNEEAGNAVKRKVSTKNKVASV